MIFTKGKSEAGSAFILALMVVAAVGLMVVPVIYLATTGLRSTNLAQQRILERYAVDAGVEQGIWIIENDPTYDPPPGDILSFSSTFNNQLTDINIKLLAFPPPMLPPPLNKHITSQGMAIGKIVDPAFVPPCLAVTCPTVDFTYTIYIENYGGNPLNLGRFGDCLPLGFLFDNAQQVTRVEGILKQTSGNPPMTVSDINGYQAVPVIDDDDSPYFDFDCDGGRQQVKWQFPPPRPFIDSYTRAEIEFHATAVIREPNEHFNMAWVHPNPNPSGFPEPIEMDEPVPVIVEFEKYDISSSAGGTTVNARATVFQYPAGNKDAYILSWQVE